MVFWWEAMTPIGELRFRMKVCKESEDLWIQYSKCKELMRNCCELNVGLRNFFNSTFDIFRSQLDVINICRQKRKQRDLCHLIRSC